jgi:hypothetical protein
MVMHSSSWRSPFKSPFSTSVRHVVPRLALLQRIAKALGARLLVDIRLDPPAGHGSFARAKTG